MATTASTRRKGQGARCKGQDQHQQIGVRCSNNMQFQPPPPPNSSGSAPALVECTMQQSLQLAEFLGQLTAGAAHFSMYEYSTHTRPPIARQQRPHPITDMSLRKEGHIRGGSLKSSMAPSLQLCCPQVVGGAHLLQWHSRLLVNQPSIRKACTAIHPDIGVHSLQDHVLTTHFHNHVPKRSSSILSEPRSRHDRRNNQPLNLITSEASCHIDTVISYYMLCQNLNYSGCANVVLYLH